MSVIAFSDRSDSPAAAQCYLRYLVVDQRRGQFGGRRVLLHGVIREEVRRRHPEEPGDGDEVLHGLVVALPFRSSHS
jgi:hypothetical protein